MGNEENHPKLLLLNPKVQDTLWDLFKSEKELNNLLEGYFSKTEQFFDFVDKLLPVSNMAYSCLKKC